MYAYVFFLFSQPNLGIHKLLFFITIRKWYCVTNFFSNNYIPHRNHNKLFFIIYHIFLYWSIKKFIDCLVSQYFKRYFICQNISWVLWFLLGILFQNQMMPFTLFLKFWTLFSLYLTFSEYVFRSGLNSLYKKMTYSSNQKPNICSKSGLPNSWFKSTILISDIKYLLYGTNFSFLTFQVANYYEGAHI